MAEKLTSDEVLKVAKLGRLTLTDEEIPQYAERLSAVLGFVSKLGELNVDDVEPMAHAGDMTNVLRDDVARDGIAVDVALDNAPDKSPPFFKVPKVIGDGSSA